jgi:AAA15 family ATPase/GTPase
MVQLAEINIKNFKGIQSISIEPAELNILTGKNNAGKTSLMESIAVLSDPRSLSRFGSHSTSVINQKADRSSLLGKYYKQQSSLDQFDEDGDPSKPLSQSIQIRPADHEEVFEAAINRFTEQIPDEPKKVSLFSLRRRDLQLNQKIIDIDDEKPPEHSLAELLEEVLTDSLLSIPEERIINELSDDVLTVEIEGTQRYMIHMGKAYRDIAYEIAEAAAKQLLNDNRIVSEENKNESKYEDLHALTKSVLTGRHRSDPQFVGESFPTISGIYYIDTIPTEPNNIDFKRNSVRVSKIENYLQDKNIVENLVDFSFNNLVFDQETGSRYEVPFDFMGEGFKTIVGILWQLFDDSKDGDVLIIEEPEQHMHPGYIEQLTRTLIQITRDEQLQLFITTHNPDFLDSFVSKEIQNQFGKYLHDNFRLFQLTEPLHRSLSYEDAVEDINDLNLDLRGA